MWVGTQLLKLLLFLQFSPTLVTRTDLFGRFPWLKTDHNFISVLFCSRCHCKSNPRVIFQWFGNSFWSIPNHSFHFSIDWKAKLHFANHFICFSSVNGTDYPQGLSRTLFLLGKRHRFWGSQSYSFWHWIWVSIDCFVFIADGWFHLLFSNIDHGISFASF